MVAVRFSDISLLRAASFFRIFRSMMSRSRRVPTEISLPMEETEQFLELASDPASSGRLCSRERGPEIRDGMPSQSIN